MLQVSRESEGRPTAFRKSSCQRIGFSSSSTRRVAAAHAEERAPKVVAHHVVEDRIDGCAAVV